MSLSMLTSVLSGVCDCVSMLPMGDCVSMPLCNSAMRARGSVEQLDVELRVELAVLAVAIRKRSSRGCCLSQYQEEPAPVCRH